MAGPARRLRQPGGARRRSDHPGLNQGRSLDPRATPAASAGGRFARQGAGATPSTLPGQPPRPGCAWPDDRAGAGVCAGPRLAGRDQARPWGARPGRAGTTLSRRSRAGLRPGPGAVVGPTFGRSSDRSRRPGIRPQGTSRRLARLPGRPPAAPMPRPKLLGQYDPLLLVCPIDRCWTRAPRDPGLSRGEGCP